MKNILAVAAVFLMALAPAYAQSSRPFSYLPSSDLEKLPADQKSFVEDVAKAYQKGDWRLAKTRIHSSALQDSKCSGYLKDQFSSDRLPKTYEVKVRPGKYPDSLYFRIRYNKASAKDGKEIMRMRNVVSENGRLVIEYDCDKIKRMAEGKKRQIEIMKKGSGSKMPSEIRELFE